MCGVALDSPSVCEWPLVGLGDLCNKSLCPVHRRFIGPAKLLDLGGAVLCPEHGARFDRGQWCDDASKDGTSS